MTQQEKILEIYDTLVDSMETFENIAIHLSYLYPAILRGSKIDIDKDYAPDKIFLMKMKKVFPPEHFVWEHIKIFP